MVAGPAGRRLPRRMAEVLGQLRPQRGLDHPPGQLGQQAARPGDLLRLEALQRVLQRVLGQQAREPIPSLLNRTLVCRGRDRSPPLDFIFWLDKVAFPGPHQGRVGHLDLAHFIGKFPARLGTPGRASWPGLSRRCASLSTRRAPPHPRALTDHQTLEREIAGADRFSSDAKLARAAGVAPIPVSSGKTNRHRPDRGGNRQINATLHRIAVTRLRCHPETRDYVARKRAEGKSTKEAIRCVKRHLARRIWHLLQPPPTKGTPPSPSIS